MVKRTARKPKQLTIFISYASEDRELAANFEAELLQLFAVMSSLSPVKVFRDVGIAKGADYRAVISDALDTADVLLVILTDRLKPSFAFPGFEVGYFTKSLAERPKIFGNTDRRIIPVCIGAENTMLDNIQAIEVDESKIIRVSNAATAAAGAASLGEDDNPVFSLLASISETVDTVLGNGSEGSAGLSKEDKVWRDKLSKSAARLSGCIRAYLEGRISSETYPERKIVIHADTELVVGPNGIDLSGCRIELVGNSFQVFGFPEEKNREFSWAAFTGKLPGETSGTWTEGIRALVTNALRGSNENYHVVATSKGDNAFRLFVSRIVTYVSKKTEIHIYIVKMITREYGDPQTTKLLSAINLGLQFRFMFLEDKSEFRPSRFDYPMAVDPTKEIDVWKSAVAELLGHMNLILREAQDKHLMDPDLLDLIWGVGGAPRVQEMMGAWEVARSKLYAAAQSLLTSNASEFSARQEPFRLALRDLHAKTVVMNKEYTLRAMRALAEEIGVSPGQLFEPSPTSATPDAKAPPALRPAPASSA